MISRYSSAEILDVASVRPTVMIKCKIFLCTYLSAA